MPGMRLILAIAQLSNAGLMCPACPDMHAGPGENRKLFYTGLPGCHGGVVSMQEVIENDTQAWHIGAVG